MWLNTGQAEALSPDNDSHLSNIRYQIKRCVPVSTGRISQRKVETGGPPADILSVQFRLRSTSG